MRRRLLGAALALALLAVACTAKAAPPVVLDGRPRYPSDEGVMTALTASRLTLDTRSHPIDAKVRVFASSTLQTVPLGGRVGQYVQVGLRNNKVAWVGTFSAVIQLAGSPRIAFHIGTLLRTDARHRAIFRDGTVLEVEPEAVAPPALPKRVRADIDVDRHRIRGFVQLSD